MRSLSWGWFVVVLVLLAVAVGNHLPQVWGQRTSSSQPSQAAATGDTIASHTVELGDGRQQITLIDSRNRTIAVYQVDPRNGAITLRSVRNVNWDLQMDEFNGGGKPSPKEIRSLLEQR